MNAIVYHEGVAAYDFGSGHPFKGERFPRYMNLLKRQGLLEKLQLIKQEPVKERDLLLVHTKQYIEKVKRLARQNFSLTRDTPVSPSIEAASRLIVGAGVKAAELVSNGYKLVDCVGGGLHHAGPDYGGGFCLYNDAAICARKLLEMHGYSRVIILDTDVHAGNGTMDIFYSDPNVLFLDIHQDPLSIYPGRGFIEEIGENNGKGYTVNVPLPPYVGNEAMEMVLDRVFQPLVDQFQPDVIIRNGGPDPHFLDGLGSLKLTYEGFHMIGTKVRKAAKRIDIPVINMSCSGYNPSTVAEGMYVILAGLLGLELNIREDEAPEVDESLLVEVENIIKQLSRLLTRYWGL